MKKTIFVLLCIFGLWQLPAQSLFESAVANSTNSEQAKPMLNLNGYVRAWTYGGGGNYDLAATFAEMAFKTSLEKGNTFLKSDLRLRKGISFGSSVQELEFKELYVGFKNEKVDLLLGNQIVSWGRTDGFNPTNNLTPNDYFLLSSEPDDQKQSNFMLRMKYRFLPSIELEVIGIPFYQASNYRYDLFDMGQNVAFAHEVLPNKTLINGSFAARLNFEMPTAGWSFSYFRGFDPYHGFDVQSVDWSSGSPFITNISAMYKKSTLGADVAIPLGNVIVRGEAAYNFSNNSNRKMYIPASDLGYVAGLETNLAGVTIIAQYIGKWTPNFADLVAPTLTNPTDPMAQMQYANELIDFENRIFNRRIFNQQEKTNHAASLTASKSFGYDAWNAELTGFYNITSEEWLVRPKLSWKINDSLTAAFGGSYMKGLPKTLFAYSSSVLNGAFIELKATF